MKNLINYTFNRVNTDNLRIHYLRIGNAVPLIDSLKKYSDTTIEWVQHEAKNFKEYHFPPSYQEYNGAIVNYNIDSDEIANIRKDFWEFFIWKTENKSIPVVFVIPETTKYGSLTKAELIESLSLIRLTDRPYEIFEYSEDIIEKICKWLRDVSSIVHRNTIIEDIPNGKE